MVDTVVAVGAASMIAAGLMVLGMLYLVFLGIRSDYRGTETEPPEPENE